MNEKNRLQETSENNEVFDTDHGYQEELRKDGYWYFRFRKDFFYEPKIKDMLDAADGHAFSIIYLKLCCEATPSSGKYRIVMESPEEFILRLAKDIMEEPRMTARAIKYLTESDLISISNADKTTTISVPAVAENTGKSSKKADQVRTSRKQKEQKQLSFSDRIEHKEVKRTPHGEFKNVYLSDEEYENLQSRYLNVVEIIQSVSIWKWRKQIEEHSDYALCLKFAMKDGKERVLVK